MDTGDPGAPGGVPDEEGRPPATPPAPGGEPPKPFVGSPPPGWAPQQPAGPPPAYPGWNPEGPRSAPPGPPPAYPGWNAPPGGGAAPPAWNPSPPAPPPAYPGWNASPGGAGATAPGWGPPPGGGAAPPAWNPSPPGPPPAYPGWNASPGGAGATAPGWGPPPSGWSPAAAGPGALRPRGIGELLDGAFTLYRRNFVLLVAIAAVVQIPFALLQLLVFELADIGGRLSTIQDLSRTLPSGTPLTDDQRSQLLGDLGAFVAYVAIVLVVQFLVVYPLSQAATTSAVSARYLDQPTGVAASYRAALSRWRALVAMVLWLVLLVGAVLVAAFLIALATGQPAILAVGAFGAVIVYLIVLVRTTVAPQAIVLERLGGWPGIRRSWQLTTGSGGRVFGIRLLLLLIQLIGSYVIILPLTAVVGNADLSTQQLVSQVGQAVTAVFIAPVTLVTLTLLYYDLRIRREGFDIEMLAASL